MNAEIEILKDDSDNIVLKIARKSQKQKAQKFEDFYNTLPSGHFTDEEMTLRESGSALQVF